MQTMKRWTVAAWLGLTLTLTGWAQDGKPATISPEAVQRALAAEPKPVVLDVRTSAEFTGELGHIKGAKLIPVQELEQRLAELEPYRTNTILAVCRSGNRSGKATELLRQKGFTVLNMEGGMLRWNALKLPVEK